MKNKVIFSGCSYTAGNGWEDLPAEQSLKKECKDSPYLWVNICHKESDLLNNLELVNLGQCSASNTEIFENTIRSISSHFDEVAYVICQWTAMPRYNFKVGFETWSTYESLQNIGGRPNHNVNLNKGISWPREYINDLLDRLLVLHHLHWEILKVVKYSSVITSLCAKARAKVFFVNGICPWDLDYFTVLDNTIYQPEDLTNFTKKEILNIETRDDKEIWNLYYQAHKDYQSEGGVDSKKWINLYSSFSKQIIDHNHDNRHPGIISNQKYAKQVKNFLTTQAN